MFQLSGFYCKPSLMAIDFEVVGATVLAPLRETASGPHSQCLGLRA